MADWDPKELLRPAFPGLEESDLAELASVAEIQRYPGGTILCHEGALGDTFYLIVEGHADVIKYLDEENPRRLLHRLGPGDFFGEMALVQGGPRTATVDTDGPITVLEIHRDAFMRVLTRSAPLSIRMVLKVTSRLRDADQTAIADLRHKNQELRRAYHNLERLDKAKADFIGLVGHELRTPLTVMSGYANMLKVDERVQEEKRLSTLSQGILVGIDRMQNIVDHILDVSRIDSAVLQMRRVPTAVAVLIKEVESSFESALRERQLTFHSEGLSELPFIMADGDLLYKAFYHLVMNAVKYTPDGGSIAVSGRLVQEKEGDEAIQIIVSDTGIGIDAEHHELIFEKFYQTGEVMLHSSGATKFKGGGPGLGLSIAKGAIAAHGGDVWVESAGHDEQVLPGSRFYVRLPLYEWKEGKAFEEEE